VSLFVMLLMGLVVLGVLHTLWSNRRIEAKWPRIGRFVVAQGVKAHVIERGTGPDVFVLHGAASNARELLAAFDGHLDDVRLIAPDRPGLGYSDVPPNAHDLGVQAAFLADIITQTTKEPIIGAGHSWGSAVLLRLALDRPDLVKSLILIAPASHPYKKQFNAANFIAGIPVLGDLLVWTLPALLGPLLMQSGIARGFAPGPVKPEDYGARIGTPLFFRPKSFKTNAADMEAGSVELGRQAIRYGDIKVPVTIITGQGDVIVFNSIHAGGLSRDIPHAHSFRVPGAGHMPHWVDTQLVADIIRAHVRGSDLPASPAQFPARS
jgi:pimeloyl-ACP methyl ester carboxylesterase